jgi:hypothetical protein
MGRENITTTTELLLAENPIIRAEMLRLREVHSVLGIALRRAAQEKLGAGASHKRVEALVEKWIGEAAVWREEVMSAAR